MMTSAPKTNLPSKGFTLIELAIAMGIIALLIGGAASFLGASSHSELTRHHAEFEIFTSETRELALKEKATKYLIFDKDRVWRSNSKETEFSQNLPHINFPTGAKITLYAENEWREIKAKKQYSWLISRSGLATPFILRCVHDGASYETDFDPFTVSPKADAQP